MKIENFLLFTSGIIVVLLPFFLIKSGSADVGCVLLGILYLIFCTLKKDFKYFKNFYFFFFLIIFFYININSFFSYNPEISFQVSLAYFRIILFVIALSFLFKEINNLKLYFYYSFSICILILLLGSIFQIWNNFNLQNASERISSLFGSKLIMGSYVVRLLPLIMGIGILLNFKKLNIYVLIISSILIFLSAERLSFAHLILLGFFYFYLTLNLKHLSYSIIIFLILFFCFSLFFPRNYERLFVHTFNQLNETKSIGLSYRHTLHYHTAWNMFLEKKVTGHGLKSFRYLCDHPKFTVEKKIIEDHSRKAPMNGYIKKSNIDLDGITYLRISISNDNKIIFVEDIITSRFFVDFVKDGQFVHKNQILYSYYDFFNGCNTHPHNIYLQFLSELGFIGFFIFSIIFIYALYKLLIYIFLKKKLSNLEKCSALILFGIFLNMFPFFPSGNYFNNWMLIISYLPMGFYLYLIREK